MTSLEDDWFNPEATSGFQLPSEGDRAVAGARDVAIIDVGHSGKRARIAQEREGLWAELGRCPPGHAFVAVMEEHINGVVFGPPGEAILCDLAASVLTPILAQLGRVRRVRGRVPRLGHDGRQEDQLSCSYSGSDDWCRQAAERMADNDDVLVIPICGGYGINDGGRVR
jgi:hypothetical protein